MTAGDAVVDSDAGHRISCGGTDRSACRRIAASSTVGGAAVFATRRAPVTA